MFGIGLALKECEQTLESLMIMTPCTPHLVSNIWKRMANCLMIISKCCSTDDKVVIIFFLFFRENRFGSSCKLSPVFDISCNGDNLHEMSNPVSLEKI